MNDPAETSLSEKAAFYQARSILQHRGIRITERSLADGIEAFALDMEYDAAERRSVNRKFLTLVTTRPELLGRYFAMPKPRKEPGVWFTEASAQSRIHDLLHRRGVERTPEQIGECVRAFLGKNEDCKHLQGAYEEVERRLKANKIAKFVGIFGKVDIEE